jgi:rubrerythrin
MDYKAKSKALKRKMSFEKDEREGIKEYKQAINKSKGRERSIYKRILPQEKRHLREIESI